MHTPMRLFARVRRALRRRHGAEDGFTIVEVLAAMMVLTVGIMGLAQLGTGMVVSTLRTRQRENAIAESNRQLETLRASGFARLVLDPTGAPASYTADDGATYTTAILKGAAGCGTACVPYSQSVTTNGFTYTVKTIIVGIDDPADGTGVSDADHNTTDYKRVFVELSSTGNSGPAFTYKVQTDIHNLTTDPVETVQGIHVVVQIVNPDGTQATTTDPDTGATVSVATPDNGFTVALDGAAGVIDGDVADGVYNNYDLPVGSYPCTVTNNTTTASYHPLGNPTANADSATCTVTVNTITTVTSQWVGADCSAVAGQAGDLFVHVTSSATGAVINNATVTLTPAAPYAPPATTTGDYVWNAPSIATGPYSLSVAASGYVTQSTNTCVYNGFDAQVNVVLDTVPVVPQATVNVVIKNTGSATANIEVKVGTTYVQTKSLNHNALGTYTFSVNAGTYEVTVYCVTTTENLKKTWSGKVFSANVTYWLPGPDGTKSQGIGC